MPVEITMPRLSDTMEKGTVVSWHVKEGDTVSSGDVIADIETDKATMELQTFDDGTVAKLAVGEGSQVPVGTTILILTGKGESVEDAARGDGGEAAEKPGKPREQHTPGARVRSNEPDEDDGVKRAIEGVGFHRRVVDAAEHGVSNVVARTHRSASGGGRSESGGSSGGRVFASPLARKIAAEEGVSLEGLTGTGPGGRIVRKDVEEALAAGVPGAGAEGASGRTTSSSAGRREERAAPRPGVTLPPRGAALEEKTVPLSGMRETIAKRLVESKTTIPHYQVTVSVRMDALMDLREQLNEQLESQGVKLSVNDFLVRACALAMHQHPYVNSSWEPKGPAIKLHGRVNIGVAIALPEERGGGLVVATLRDADHAGLRQISGETRRLAKKAREKGLTLDEMADATFTISNLGMFGVDHFTAIINPPNVAILAVGCAIEKPFIEYGQDGQPELVVGHEMAMTMSSDHRVVDGAMAAAYLNTVKELLESPAALLV
ncbi:MAG: 2-oxo acid dehydrogenase subunit E2 [Leptolyngbya sp. PLA3]|nr:MAG: 2-oxo acid dehydrogenase subunit E2 [Cyanobacteria bacterium CYA]MCE7968984.1 2-oxo acid dehydrogenase subunit E2 [Leptolyngbya sp. PL-A3]